MAISTISLGKVKFNWRGDWASGTTYAKDDVVKYGPNVYNCVTAHSSQPNFTDNSADWEIMVPGIDSVGEWVNGTLYRVNEIVVYGGGIYICTAEHVASLTIQPSDTGYWTKFVEGQQFEGPYAGATQYQKGDIVSYGGYLYVAKGDAQGIIPTDTASWDVYVKGYNDRGLFTLGALYLPGDTVGLGGNKYRVKEGRSTSTTYPTDIADWEPILRGFNWRGVWNAQQPYYSNDVVRYGGNLYLLGDVTILFEGGISNANPEVDDRWALYSVGFNWTGEYDANTNYRVGDVARLGARAFICVEGYENDGSTTPEPPNTDYWELLVDGIGWKGPYDPVVEYEQGDVVEFAQSSYVCIGNDVVGVEPGSDANIWQILAQGDISSPMTTEGDMIYRNSTGNVERLPIGDDGAMMVVNNGIPSWGHRTPQTEYYVSLEGDDANDGRTANTSWRTLHHAANATFSEGQVKINIAAGVYEELCPLRLGRSVVLEGNGLGAVTVVPDNTNDKGYGVGISTDGSTPNANQFVFLMNNGTRIRNIVFRNFSTGAVMTSLDPGYGPDDTSVWITSQSPYVQNCTSFAPEGTGMLIDGSLHNGGYKSAVANDWTQINSDGIGIHVKSDARVELVSVFTYYCNIGYLAESGGKIRALVGNNSYGEFGAVARGYSQSETPLTGKLRLNDKTIDAIIQLQSNMHVFTSYRDEVGNRFFVGHTNPTGTDITSTYDPAASYPIVAKYNSAGSLDWIFTYESSFGAIHNVVEVSNRIVCGGVIEDGGTKGFLLAISKAGEIQWQKTVGNTTEIVDVTTDTNGDALYAVGNHVSAGVAVLKTSPAGTEQWATTLSYNDSSASGTLVAQACTFAKAPTTSVDTYALAGDATAENQLYVASYDTTVNTSLITRIDTFGTYQETYQYGDLRINALTLDTGNGDGIYLMAAGSYDPVGAVTSNPIAFRLSVDGSVQWQSQVSLGDENGAWNDVIAFGNDVYCVGYMNESTNTNNAALISRYSSNGSQTWTFKFDNGTNNIAYNGVMLDGVNVIAAGIEEGNSFITNIQRDYAEGIGTPGIGAYALTQAPVVFDTSTVVTAGNNEIDSANVALGLNNTTLSLNQGPTQTATVASTRPGFAGIGTGVLFNVDSIDRIPKDGSVLQIDGDNETYFVIGVSNFQESSYTSGNNPNAQGILTANKEFLQEEIIAWQNDRITNNIGIWAGFTYQEETCKRDVGLVIDALISDLDINSNGNSIDAAYAYYDSASGLYSILNQEPQAIESWGYFKSIVDDILNQSAITPTTGNGLTQTTGLGAAEAGTVTLTENNVDAFTSHLIDGRSGGPAKINFGVAQIQLDPPIPSNKTPDDNTFIVFREAFSQVRMTGHDFLDIGTGGFADTNYPVIIQADYPQQPDQNREVVSEEGGRVFYVTTDQDGDFRVGDYFKVEQATGRATLSSEEFDLTGLNELQLGSITAGKQGATINEFSTDGTFADNSDESVPTEKATKTYIDTQIVNAIGDNNSIQSGAEPATSKVEVTATTINFELGGTQVSQIGEQYLLIPAGATADRPTAVAGQMRFNTDINALEVYNGAAWVPAGGFSNVELAAPDSPYNASTFQYLFTDTTSGPITVNLPSSANLGDQIKVIDIAGNAGTSAITITPNGLKIFGATDNLVVNNDNAAFGLVYTGATYGWQLMEV